MSKNKTQIVIALSFASALIAAKPTEAVAAEAQVKGQGSLDKAVIRNVIRQHIGEVKKCYETELGKKPDLAGKVMVHFIIGIDGKVTESSIQESSLHSPAGEQCITAAVRGWEFPKPRGGTVVVSYPFVLAAAEPAGEGKP